MNCAILSTITYRLAIGIIINTCIIAKSIKIMIIMGPIANKYQGGIRAKERRKVRYKKCSEGSATPLKNKKI